MQPSQAAVCWCTSYKALGQTCCNFFLLDGVDGISGICRLALSHEAEDRIICSLWEENRKRGGEHSALGGSGGSPLTGATLVSVRTACSQGGRYAEPQITVVIIPDCLHLRQMFSISFLVSSNSLSDPSLLADGQLGALQVCQDLVVLSRCSNCSLKGRGQTQHTGTQVCFPTCSIRTNALLSFQKYFADEPWPNGVGQSTNKDRLIRVLCLLAPVAKILQTSRVNKKKSQEPLKVIPQMA